MKTYLQIMIQTQQTAFVTHPLPPCNHLHSAEGFSKKVCATNSVENVLDTAVEWMLFEWE